jgi:hypothetical protein
MQSGKGQNQASLISCSTTTKLWEARSQHGPLLWGKNILQWTFMDVTKEKFFGLDTLLYKPHMQVGNSNKMNSNK